MKKVIKYILFGLLIFGFVADVITVFASIKNCRNSGDNPVNANVNIPENNLDPSSSNVTDYYYVASR